MEFIKADIKDAPNIEKLAFQIYPEYYADIVSHEYTLFLVHKFQSSEAIINQIQNGYVYYFIKKDHMIIGYICFYKENDYPIMTLSKLYLLKKYRGLGYGQFAMNFIIENAKNLNISQIKLYVNRKNEKAINFYKKYDFSITKELINAFDNGYSFLDYEMVRQL